MAWGAGVGRASRIQHFLPSTPHPAWHCFTRGAPGPLGLHPLAPAPWPPNGRLWSTVPSSSAPASRPSPPFPTQSRGEGWEPLGCCWGGHLGRAFSPGSVSTSSGQKGGTTERRGAPSKELDGKVGPRPCFQDSWGLGSPHPGSPGPWASWPWPPRTSECSWAREGVGRSGLPRPAFRLHPSALQPPHLIRSAIPSPPLLGIQMVSTMAHPRPRGARA